MALLHHTFRLDSATTDNISQIAKEENKSKSQVLRKAIATYLEQKKPQN